MQPYSDACGLFFRKKYEKPALERLERYIKFRIQLNPSDYFKIPAWSGISLRSPAALLHITKRFLLKLCFEVVVPKTLELSPIGPKICGLTEALNDV